MDPTPLCVWPLGAELGEGPIWSASEQALWFVDIKLNKLHRFEPATGAMTSWPTLSSPSFIAPLHDGAFIVGLKAGLHRFEPATGDFELLRVVEPDHLGNRLNDACVDWGGALWFGSMHDLQTDASGALYRYAVGDQLVRKEAGVCITNGPAFSPDQKTFYHTDTMKRTVYAYNAGEEGALTNKRIFTQFEAADGYPDGTTVDADGGVWIASFGGGALLHFSPDGRLVSGITFPCANVTKAAFGGADLKTVYVTTARVGLDAQELESQPLSGGLFAFKTDVPGQRQHAARL